MKNIDLKRDHIFDCNIPFNFSKQYKNKPFTHQTSKNWRRNECHQFETAENEAVFCSCTSFLLGLKHTTYNIIINYNKQYIIQPIGRC